MPCKELKEDKSVTKSSDGFHPPQATKHSGPLSKPSPEISSSPIFLPFAMPQMILLVNPMRKLWFLLPGLFPFPRYPVIQRLRLLLFPIVTGLEALLRPGRSTRRYAL